MDFKYEIIDCEVIITGIKDKTTTNILIPSEINGYPVVWIGSGAFYGSTSIKTVSIPNSVIAIYESAFYNCSALKSVTIPKSIKYISQTAFGFCHSLEYINCIKLNKCAIINNVFLFYNEYLYKIKYQIDYDYICDTNLGLTPVIDNTMYFNIHI